MSRKTIEHILKEETKNQKIRYAFHFIFLICIQSDNVHLAIGRINQRHDVLAHLSVLEISEWDYRIQKCIAFAMQKRELSFNLKESFDNEMKMNIDKESFLSY